MAAKYASMVAEKPKRAASTASRKYPVKATPKVNQLDNANGASAVGMCG